MAKKENGYGYPNPYNEIGSGDEPDNNELYGSFDEVMKMHLTHGPIDETPNSRSGHGVMGGPAPGEPNPAKSGD